MRAGSFTIAVSFALTGMPSAGLAAGSDAVAGTTWRVAAINGEATPSNRYTMNFDGGTVSGRLGCNDYGGNFSLATGGLTVRALRATSRVCGDTAATFEGGALVVLSLPMRVDWAGARRLTLANANGTIALERLP